MLLKALIGLGVLGALFVGLSYAMALRNEARGLAAYPPEGRLVMVDGHPVHVVQMGSGPDLVLIHGSGGNTRDMGMALAPALATDYRVTLIDRPGLGHTPAVSKDGDSIADQARLLASAAQQAGVRDPIVLGHSYGGAVALAWALDPTLPPAALVVLAGASNPWDSDLPPFYRATTHRVFGGLVRLMLSAWVPDSYVARSIEGIFSPQAAPEGYGENIGAPLSLRRSALRANGLQRAQLLDQIRAQVPRYAEIPVPTEILHGDADKTVGLHIHSVPLSRQIPDATLTVLPSIGHMPQHSAAPDVIAAIHRAATRAGLR